MFPFIDSKSLPARYFSWVSLLAPSRQTIMLSRPELKASSSYRSKRTVLVLTVVWMPREPAYLTILKISLFKSGSPAQPKLIDFRPGISSIIFLKFARESNPLSLFRPDIGQRAHFKLQ